MREHATFAASSHYLSRWFTGAGKQSPAGPLQSISQNSRVLFITIRLTVAPSAGRSVQLSVIVSLVGEPSCWHNARCLPPRCGCAALRESTTHPDPSPLPPPTNTTVTNIIPTVVIIHGQVLAYNLYKLNGWQSLGVVQVLMFYGSQGFRLFV